MAGKCTICMHPNKLDIERAYARGRSLASIAREFGVGEAPLRNHCPDHVSRQMMQHIRKQEAIQSTTLLSDIQDLISRTKQILTKAEEKGQNHLALKAIGEARNSYDLLLRIAVALHDYQRDEYEREQEQREQEDREAFRKSFEKKSQCLSPAERNLFRILVTKYTVQDSSIKILPKRITPEELLSRALGFYPEDKKPFKFEDYEIIERKHDLSDLEANPISNTEEGEKTPYTPRERTKRPGKGNSDHVVNENTSSDDDLRVRDLPPLNNLRRDYH